MTDETRPPVQHEAVSETAGAPDVPWQPEPFGVPGSGYVHPSLDEFQRPGAFYLDPTPPTDGARMAKGPTYHAPCGNPISTKFLDDGAPGEYGCRECNERGYLLPPGLAPRAERTLADGADTRALIAVEAAERLAAKAHQALAEIPEDDLSMAPLSVLDAIERAQAILDELAATTTNTTCSLVKDQAWSDEISRAAAASVSRSMERIGS